MVWVVLGSWSLVAAGGSEKHLSIHNGFQWGIPLSTCPSGVLQRTGGSRASIYQTKLKLRDATLHLLVEVKADMTPTIRLSWSVLEQRPLRPRT